MTEWQPSGREPPFLLIGTNRIELTQTRTGVNGFSELGASLPGGGVTLPVTIDTSTMIDVRVRGFVFHSEIGPYALSRLGTSGAFAHQTTFQIVPGTDLFLNLIPCGKIKGVVFNASNRKTPVPLGNVKLRTTERQGGRRGAVVFDEVITNAKGEYELYVDPWKSYDVLIDRTTHPGDLHPLSSGGMIDHNASFSSESHVEDNQQAILNRGPRTAGSGWSIKSGNEETFNIYLFPASVPVITHLNAGSGDVNNGSLVVEVDSALGTVVTIQVKGHSFKNHTGFQVVSGIKVDSRWFPYTNDSDTNGTLTIDSTATEGEYWLILRNHIGEGSNLTIAGAPYHFTIKKKTP